MKPPTVIPTAFLATIVLFAALGGARSAPRLGAQQPAARPHSRPVARAWSLSERFASERRVLTDSTPLYTEEQATSGAEVYAKVCAECHEKPDVTGADFRSNWNGRSLYELYEEIRTTMPDDNPGALSRDEYAGALAYILKLNGLPAGPTAIMPDSALMSGAKLVLPPPAF